jgi:TRAP-type C4-dicarboxylate transport system substrate-binding protein
MRRNPLSRGLGITLISVAITIAASGCDATSSSDKAGSERESKPVVLTMANGNDSAVELEPFADAVADLSDGTLRIKFANGWRQGTPDYETKLIGDVKAGKADLGWAGTRAFDSVGVAAFDALHAPLLIDSYELEQNVLKSPLAGQMLQALEPLGLVGLGILPGPMRKPLGVDRLVRPEDYRGQELAIARSRVAEDTLRAVGAIPHAIPSAGEIDGLDGVEQQIASIQGNRYDSVARYLTTNVNLWPRLPVIFMNREAYAALSDTQRQALKDAARGALGPSLASQRRDQDESAAILCRRGLKFVTASDADIAALRDAVAPVYRRLEGDELTATAIEEIRSMRTDDTRPDAPACERGGESKSVAGEATPIDGVYSMTTTAEEVAAVPPGMAPEEVESENYGRWRFVLDHGRLYYTQSSEGASRWTKAKYQVRGDQLTFEVTSYGGEAPNGAAEKTGEVFTFRWSRYRDRLTLAPVIGKVSPENFRAKPWRRIGDAD